MEEYKENLEEKKTHDFLQNKMNDSRYNIDYLISEACCGKEERENEAYSTIIEIAEENKGFIHEKVISQLSFQMPINREYFFKLIYVIIKQKSKKEIEDLLSEYYIFMIKTELDNDISHEEIGIIYSIYSAIIDKECSEVCRIFIDEHLFDKIMACDLILDENKKPKEPTISFEICGIFGLFQSLIKYCRSNDIDISRIYPHVVQLIHYSFKYFDINQQLEATKCISMIIFLSDGENCDCLFNRDIVCYLINNAKMYDNETLCEESLTSLENISSLNDGFLNIIIDCDLFSISFECIKTVKGQKSFLKIMLNFAAVDDVSVITKLIRSPWFAYFSDLSIDCPIFIKKNLAVIFSQIIISGISFNTLKGKESVETNSLPADLFSSVPSALEIMLHSLSTLHSEKLRSVLKAMYFLVHSASIKQDEESQKLLDSLSDNSDFHDVLDAIIDSDDENRLIIEYATQICAILYEDDDGD